MALPVEVGGAPTRQLTPAEIAAGTKAYSDLAAAQTAYDKAVNFYGANSPITSAFTFAVDEAKGKLKDFQTSTTSTNVAQDPNKSQQQLQQQQQQQQGPTGPTLAFDTFKNTLALAMGSDEAAKPYVSELYKLVSGFYKTGATISDSINLALYQAQQEKKIPEFTNRFSGIFKLQERRAKGEAIDVPTLAEYVKSQAAIGDVLRGVGLNDLANETFLNDVMGTGKSVAATTRIISDVFTLIDTAPADWKAQVAKTMPTASRADLAKALLTGAQGAAELERKVNIAGLTAAAATQGLTIGEQQAAELLAKNQTYRTAGPQFGRIATYLPVAQKLKSIETGVPLEQAYTLEQAISATFDQSAAELKTLADLAERERARMSGSAGTIGSRALASQVRGAAGQI